MDLTLILGGAASGKSAFAETAALKSGRSPVYIATAQAFDTEMADKISAHRAARGEGWHTIEDPLTPHAALAGLGTDHIVLIDCATLWLSNLMLADRDVAAATDALMDALAGCAAPCIIVSNEVGMGLVPDTPLGRDFRDAQGRLNQRLAAAAHSVVFVAAGLPLALKGNLP